MGNISHEEMLSIVKKAIGNLENKDFNVYFFVIDTKGNPSSQLEYIYQTALTLKKLGYNVAMLHQEKDFVGVCDWLGEEYNAIPHYNIEKENVSIGVSDFLFIPEILANVMLQTKNLPCKRVVIVQNYNHITEFMPVSQNMGNLGIHDVVVNTEAQSDKILSYFPEVKTHVVHPSIKSKFKKGEKPQQMIINIVAKDQTVINQIVKPFYWMFEQYKWVSFRDLRGVTQDVFADALRESAITIWVDDKTNFGYTLLDALRSGGVVLAKVPSHPSDWMLDDEGNLTSDILWFDDLDLVPDMICKLVRNWTLDTIPEEIYDNQDKFSKLFSEEQQENEIKEVYVDGIFNKRLKDFKEVMEDIENNSIDKK